MAGINMSKIYEAHPELRKNVSEEKPKPMTSSELISWAEDQLKEMRKEREEFLKKNPEFSRFFKK